jgi:hypothetical protein
MTMIFAAVHKSVYGTMSAIGGKADIPFWPRHVGF